MHSLFEEQILRQRYGFAHLTETHAESSAEAESYFPFTEEFALGPHKYLEQVRRIKARVAVPVIASLNGTTSEGWLEYAHLIEQAGADALEINFYHVSTSPLDDGRAVERSLIDIVAGGEGKRLDSGGGEAVAVLLVPAARGGAAGLARHRRPGALQPLLPG